MSWFEQQQILAIAGESLPTWRRQCLFTVSRLSGAEKLGRLYRYSAELATPDDMDLSVAAAQAVELATPDDMALSVRAAQAMVDIDALVGKEVTLQITIEGSGTGAAGKPAAYVRYRIETVEGQVFQGMTDEQGLTPRIMTMSPQALNIFLET